VHEEVAAVARFFFANGNTLRFLVAANKCCSCKWMLRLQMTIVFDCQKQGH